MRLPTLISIGLAAAGAAALSAPALAHGSHPAGEPMPPLDMPMDHRDMPMDHENMPPPDYPGSPPYPGYPGQYGPWQYPGGPMPSAPMAPWMPPCAEHHQPAGAPPCGAYPAYPGYPMMTYAVPMMMVPVLRQKPCPEQVIEEWVEEPAPLRRRHIAPRVRDKRVKFAPVPDKRVPVAPDKRISY